jgi:hypothetical protein
MAYRVTEQDVRDVIDVPPGTDVTPFIVLANLEVTERCVPAGYTAPRLKEIERWYAAHLLLLNKQRPKQSEGVGGGSWSMTSPQLGKKLESTMPGQQVLQLDYACTLLNPSSVTWAGVAEDDYTAGGAHDVG